MFRKRHRRRPEEVCEPVCKEKECVVTETVEYETECHEECVVEPTCCEGRIVTTRNVPETTSTNAFPSGIVTPSGPLLVKIPVVLSEVCVQADVESIIKLDEPALDIKRIKKNVVVTQCKLLLPTNKLFIAGYVRKNIEYATAGCVTQSGVSGKIKHTTVKVPFELVSPIPIANPAVFEETELPVEFDFINKCLAGKSRETDFLNFESFNEKPFCEVVNAVIIEADFECGHKPVGCSDEFTFQEVKEKMVILLTVKVAQTQQVVVIGAPVCPPTNYLG